MSPKKSPYPQVAAMQSTNMHDCMIVPLNSNWSKEESIEDIWDHLVLPDNDRTLNNTLGSKSTGGTAEIAQGA